MVNFNVCMVTRYFSAKARIIDKYTHAFEFIHRTLQFSNVIYMLHLSEQRPHSRSLTVARSICSRSLSHVRSALARCRTFDLLSLAHRSHFSTRSLAHILTCIARSTICTTLQFCSIPASCALASTLRLFVHSCIFTSLLILNTYVSAISHY